MATIQLKRGSSEDLEGVKAQLKAGEPIFLTNTKQFAVFDGENVNIISRDAKSFPVADEEAMLALTDAAVGDMAVRADSTKYILTALPASEVTNWVPLPTTDDLKNAGFLTEDSVIDCGTF